MKLIVGSPGSGKTREILKLSEENNIPILCESADRVTRLMIKAQGYGFKIPTPVVYDEVKESESVYVDDVSRLLKAMLPCKVDIITYNSEEKEDVRVLA